MPATLSTATPLADLALTSAAATAVFQRYRLDYCCQGRRPLAEAAAGKGLDAQVILDEIKAAEALRHEPAHPWHQVPLADLIDHVLTTFHEPHRQELRDLQFLAKKVEHVHAGHEACPHGLAATLATIEGELLEHMAKEEGILFPLIRSGQGQACLGPVRVMESEHIGHGNQLENLHRVAKGYQPPEGACTSWRALYLRLDKLHTDLMNHIHLENHVLFPRALTGD